MTEDTIKVKYELPNNSIRRAIEKVVEDRGFVEYDMKLDAGSNSGDNYIGIVYRIHISGIKKNGESENFNLFCKISPLHEARRKQFRVRATFVREAFVYNKLLPEFCKFSQKKGITEHGFGAYPKCYEANTEDHEEYLLMEDIRENGFLMFDKHSVLDIDHATLVMEELGKFHAISFAMKDQDIEKFKQLTDLPETFWTNPLKPSTVSALEAMLSKAKESLNDTDVECIEKFNNFNESHLDTFYQLFDFKNAEPYAIITHGDCWNNNILYKYENQKPVGACFLDWQLTHYSSPVLDLLYFIFTSTEKPLRDEHYDDLLRVYHGSLSNFLTRLGSDPEELFPYSALQEQLKKFGSFAMIMASLLIPVIISAGDDAPDLDELSEKMNEDPANATVFFVDNDKTAHAFKKRMRDTITDLVRDRIYDLRINIMLHLVHTNATFLALFHVTDRTIVKRLKK